MVYAAKKKQQPLPPQNLHRLGKKMPGWACRTQHINSLGSAQPVLPALSPASCIWPATKLLLFLLIP